jgi:hypothetical protein
MSELDNPAMKNLWLLALLSHGGSHGIFDRLHVVDLRGVRFGVAQASDLLR